MTERYHLSYYEIHTYKEAKKFLNKTFGKDWDKRINLSKLNLSDGAHCILGQLYGSWMTAKEELFSGTRAHTNCTCAFSSATTIPWREKILKRRWKRLIRELNS